MAGMAGQVEHWKLRLGTADSSELTRGSALTGVHPADIEHPQNESRAPADTNARDSLEGQSFVSGGRIRLIDASSDPSMHLA